MAFDMSGNNLRICGYDAEAILNQLSELQEERDRLKIDRDEKEVMINAFDKIQKLFNGYEWIKEGRGPYAYDDEGYRKEVTNLYEEFDRIKDDTWSNIKPRTHEYRDAITKDLREEYTKIIKSLKEELQSWKDEHNQIVLDCGDRLKELLEENNILKERIAELEANPCTFCGCSLASHREDLTCPNFAFGELRGWLDHKFMAS